MKNPIPKTALGVFISRNSSGSSNSSGWLEGECRMTGFGREDFPLFLKTLEEMTEKRDRPSLSISAFFSDG
jgi:hypothetical protein